MIGPSQGPIPDNKKITRDRRPCPRRHSNPTILTTERLQDRALDRAATGIGPELQILLINPSQIYEVQEFVNTIRKEK